MITGVFGKRNALMMQAAISPSSILRERGVPSPAANLRRLAGAEGAPGLGGFTFPDWVVFT
jgi:hypothetical protein